MGINVEKYKVIYNDVEEYGSADEFIRIIEDESCFDSLRDLWKIFQHNYPASAKIFSKFLQSTCNQKSKSILQ